MTENSQTTILAILELIKRSLAEQDKEMNFKINFDKENNIIKIYTLEVDQKNKALAGVNEVLEMAYTTAEHHPYWSILYNSLEISKSILEKWDDKITEDQISEMIWRTDEIKNALERFSN